MMLISIRIRVRVQKNDKINQICAGLFPQNFNNVNNFFHPNAIITRNEAYDYICGKNID